MPCTPQNRAVSVRLAAVCTTVGLLLGSALVAAPALAAAKKAQDDAAAAQKVCVTGCHFPIQAVALQS